MSEPLTNLQKMNELVGSDETKEQIIAWANMNRTMLNCLDLEIEFQCMGKSIQHFIELHGYSDDEHANWDRFLDADYIEDDAI